MPNCHYECLTVAIQSCCPVYMSNICCQNCILKRKYPQIVFFALLYIRLTNIYFQEVHERKLTTIVWKKNHLGSKSKHFHRFSFIDFP